MLMIDIPVLQYIAKPGPVVRVYMQACWAAATGPILECIHVYVHGVLEYVHVRVHSSPSICKIAIFNIAIAAYRYSSTGIE